MKAPRTHDSSCAQPWRERGAIFIEGALVVPAFFFILMAGIQLMVISWKLSQVQLATTQMARTLGVPPSQGVQDTCVAVRTAANAAGQQIFGNSVTATNVTFTPPTCPPAPGTTVVLNVSYTAQIFMGTLIPGQQTFTYRGVAVAIVEQNPVEL